MTKKTTQGALTKKDIEKLLDEQTKTILSAVHNRLDKFETRLDIVDKTLDKFETRFDTLDERLEK